MWSLTESLDSSIGVIEAIYGLAWSPGVAVLFHLVMGVFTGFSNHKAAIVSGARIDGIR
jgi:hypothetical protein